MCEPLSGKKKLKPEGFVSEEAWIFVSEDVKSAVQGLIKYHEECIEEIESIYSESTELIDEELKFGDSASIGLIRTHLNCTMAIELWLEDAVEVETQCEMCGCPESFHYVETNEQKYGDKHEHCICKNCGVCF